MGSFTFLTISNGFLKCSKDTGNLETVFFGLIRLFQLEEKIVLDQFQQKKQIFSQRRIEIDIIEGAKTRKFSYSYRIFFQLKYNFQMQFCDFGGELLPLSPPPTSCLFPLIISEAGIDFAPMLV